MAQRLSTIAWSGDTLSRLSSDEFVLLCEELGSVDDVSKLVGRIDEMFAEPSQRGDVTVAVRTSVGTAYVGPGEAITSDLLMRANLDMYRAKREGSGAEVIEISKLPMGACDQSLEDDMRQALDDGELEVAYQPMIRTLAGPSGRGSGHQLASFHVTSQL